jgi:hypothetical protein
MSQGIISISAKAPIYRGKRTRRDQRKNEIGLTENNVAWNGRTLATTG